VHKITVLTGESNSPDCIYLQATIAINLNGQESLETKTPRKIQRNATESENDYSTEASGKRAP